MKGFVTLIAGLVRSPCTTAIIIVILALGIGANSAIYSLMNAIMLRPLPIPHPELLVSLSTTIADNVNGEESISFPVFQELMRSQIVFSQMFASTEGGIENLEVEGNHVTVAVARVSGDYYAAMQIVPVLGRFINRGDVALDSGVSPAVAVLKYRAWRSWYRGEPNVVGKTIRVGVQPFTIIGVEPEGFNGIIIDGSSDVTIPLFSPGSYSVRDAKQLWLDVGGRLRPGTNMAQARAFFETLWPPILRATVPADYEGARSKRYFARRIKVQPAGQGTSYLRKRFAHPLRILLAMVGSLLFLACLNLANLSIAKMASQQQDWSIKLALGAGLWDLVGPILAESLVLAAAGGMLGLAIAYWTGPFLLHMAWQGYVTTALNAAPDLRVLLFTSAVSLLTGLLCAAIPACYALRAEAAHGLRRNSRSVQGGSAQFGKVLLGAQIAFSLVLVTGAMLFGKTLVHLHTVDTGYRRDHLLTLQLFPQPGGGKLPNRSTYYRGLSEAVKRLPGAALVSYSNGAPANGYEFFLPMRLTPTSAEVQAIDEVVGPDFFATVGVKVLAGREFAWNDDEHSLPVAIVSKTFAESLYGDADPVGRDFYWGVASVQQKMRIVGVVSNARLWKVDSVAPTAVYRPLLQTPNYNEPLLDVRTSLDPDRLKSGVERAIRGMGHHYSLRTITVDERLASVTTAQRLIALSAEFFGAVSLLIAAAGLYGLMSFQTNQRRKEFAVRLALGARGGQVLRMILREAAFIAALGCVVGLAASVALRSYVANILSGVSATDPLLLGLAVLTLLTVALLAGCLPASKAASVDPAVALRKE